MAQLKHIQEIERAIRAMAPGVQLSYRPGRKHRMLRVEYAGRCAVFSLSSSPTEPVIAVRNSVREVARKFNLTPTIRC